MANDAAERLLLQIADLLAEDTEYPLDGTLLYAELDDNYVSPAIFKERGNHVLYRWPDLERLGDALLDLWEAQEAGHRWEEMEYVIRGDSFEVTYTFPDEIDPDEDSFVRRRRIVKRHFGDKPIVYPPWPPDDDLPEYEL